MSETLPRFSNLTQEQVLEGGRRTKATLPNVAASWAQLQSETPLLAHFLGVAQSQLIQLWTAEDLMVDFRTGAAASHLLLRHLAKTHDISFPQEKHTGDTARGLSTCYGRFELIGERNKSRVEVLENFTTHDDAIAAGTTLREFESEHPDWYIAGTRMSARYLGWPLSHFEPFLADGRLLITDAPLAAESYSRKDIDASAPYDSDRFALFAEGFADVSRLILGAEAKRDFEAQFQQQP